MHAPLGVRDADAQRVDTPASVASRLQPGPSEHHESIVEPAEVAERCERVFVAVVRSGGEQQHVGCAPAQTRHGLATIGFSACAVRLVHDDHVPVGRQHGREHFGALDEIHRRDDQRLRGPGIHADGQRGPDPAHASLIEDRQRQIEACCAFLNPLIAQPGRTYDEHTGRGAARTKFSHREHGLHCLAEPHFVGDEQPAAEAVQQCHRRLELVRQKQNASSSGRSHRPYRAISGDERLTRVTPRANADAPRSACSASRFDIIERVNEADHLWCAVVRVPG